MASTVYLHVLAEVNIIANNSYSQLWRVYPLSQQDKKTLARQINPQQDVLTLYSDHHNWLQSWLLAKLGNRFDAADLAQDVFVRLLNRQQTIQPKQPRAFLSSIARGLVIDHWRRRELERTWLEILSTLPEEEAPSPETQLLFLETLNTIDRVLDSLKPPIRQAFLLAQLEGFTCPQIAKKLDVSLATVERYIAKALRRCYECRYEA